MDRRDFLKSSALIAIGSAVSQTVKGETTKSQEENKFTDETSAPLIASAPMLQNYADTSIGVAFAVSHLANGFVTYGEKPDLSDGKTVMCGGYRVMDVNENVMQIRLTGLKTATKYYYQIGAHKIYYKDYHHKKVMGTEIDPKIYSFTTAGKNASSHFCVINDTHERWEPFGLSMEKIAQLNPSCVIWNGDAPRNAAETMEDQKRIFLNPNIERKDYASTTPYLFVNGNHDDRGWANRHLERVLMFRQPEERSSRDWNLGRNFAVRMGDIALIGLDTAEDKVDENPRFIGIYNSEAYRVAQVAWLEDALKQPEISSAPFLVAFCHIPLYDSNPKANPGDVHPADKDEAYTHDYAIWQRTCAQLWTPLLQKAGCQVIITAHQHRYRYDAPTAERTWAHIVGGGPNMGYQIKDGKRVDTPNFTGFPTVIEGKVVKNKLEIIVHNIATGKVQDTFSFKKRK